MNKSKLAGALLLLVSIISPSCDSKPKPAPTEPAPTEQAPTEQAPTGQEQTEQAPAEPALAEPSASEEAPSDQPPSEEAPSEMGQTESTPTEEAPADEDSQDDILLKAKLDYIKLLIKSMGNALEQRKLEKVSELAKEIHKVASEANADQETGVSQPNEMTEVATPEPRTESDPAESSDATSSAESGESQDENKTEEQAPEGEPESAEKEDEKNQLSKFKIRIDVVPRSSNKKEEYYVNEEINLKIKVANLNLKDKTGPIHMQYYLLGKGTKNSGEYVLFDSGEKSFELGKTQSDRSFEYSTDTFTNKYGVYGGSGNYKFDTWFVVVIDDEGNVIQTKSNKQNLKDYDLIKNMDKNFRYDKSFKKLDGVRRYMYN